MTKTTGTLLALVASTLLPACGGRGPEPNMSEIEQFAADYTAAWNSGDPDEVASFYAENGWLEINGGERNVGRKALAAVAESFMTAFPDLHIEFDRIELVDGRVHYYWTFRGTNTGPGGTGNAVDFSGFESWVFDDDGLVAESIGTFDQAEYERQLEHGVHSE